MELIHDYNLLNFIKETYPVSSITVIVIMFGYTLGTVGFRLHIKILKEILSDTIRSILDRVKL